MPVAVVKLGSSIVAEDNGELRLSVVARITEEVAALHRAGVDVVIVTSGAIARGVQMLELSVRPSAIEELQAASAVGQGRLYRTYDELLRERGIQSAQMLLTFFDMSVRTHYVNARRTLRKLLEWRIVPVINENDTTTTDEISFGDNDFLAAQVAVLAGGAAAAAADRPGGALHGRPARGARRGARARGRRRRDARRARHRPLGVAARLGRDALEGRGGRDGGRGGHPDGDRLRPRARRARRAPGTGRRTAPASCASPCATRASSSGSSTPSPRAAR